MKSNITQPTDNSVQKYLSSIQDDKKRNDAKLLLEIMKEVTKDKPILWGESIIGFGLHHYRYESGREGDTVAVGFSARKAALVLYGIFHFDKNDKNIELANKLGTYTNGKGCVYIKSMDDINLPILKKMLLNAYRTRSSNN